MPHPVLRSIQILQHSPGEEEINAYVREVSDRIDFAFGPGEKTRERRDDVTREADESAESWGKVLETDSELLEEIIIDEDEMWPGNLLIDDPIRPFSNWWWHLGAIRAGTFPLDQFPEYLMPVYHEAVAEREEYDRQEQEPIQMENIGAQSIRYTVPRR